MGNNKPLSYFSNNLLPILAGKLLPILFLTITMVLYARKLSYTDYGQFQTIWIYRSILSVIISFGISSIILSTNIDNFYSFLKNNKLRISLLYAFGTLITFVIFYFTTYTFSNTTKYLLIAFVLLQSFCTLIDTLFIKKNLLKIYVWINLIYTILFFAIHLYFFYMNFVLNQLILAVIFLSLIKCICIFLLPQQHNKISDETTPINLSANWIFIGLNDITGIVARWLDKLFLLYLLTPAKFAIFFNGSFEIPLFAILISAMESIMLTNISADLYNKQGVQNIFKESFKLLSIIAFPIFFFLLIMHAEIFAIVFKNKYNESIPIFLISICIIPIRITHYGVILQCYGQSKIVTLGAVLDIFLSLVLMFILYPILGTAGVALAIIIATYLQVSFYIWQSAKVIKVKIGAIVPISFLMKLFTITATLYFLLYNCKHIFSNLVSLLIVFIITCIIIMVSCFLHIKKNEKSVFI